MKRHIQNAGVKKWFGDYLVELETEPLKAIDLIASAYGGCIISGGVINEVSDPIYEITPALVVLKIEAVYKVAPLPLTEDIDISVQKVIRLKKTAITGQYQNPSDLTIAYDYSAEVINYTAGLGTLNEDYLLIPTTGAAVRCYADVIKEAIALATTAAKGLMSASDKSKLDAITGTNSGDETTTTIGAKINAATAKTTPVDADMVGLMDSAAGNILKKLSWANIKVTLKAYFDTVYTLVNLGLTATAAELNYCDGVTSAIQTQLGTKAPVASPTFTGLVTAPKITARKIPAIQTIASASAVVINYDTNDGVKITALAVACSFSAPTGTPSDMQMIALRIKDNGTARALTWNAAFIAMGVTLPTTTTAGKTMNLAFMYDSVTSKLGLVSLTTEV